MSGQQGNLDADGPGRRLAPPFARALLANVIGLVAVLGLTLLGAMVWQNAASTAEAARQEIGETLTRASGRLHILVRAAEMVAMSAERVVRTAGVTGATLRPALENLLPAFEQRPELSYLGIVLPETGEYGTLERAAGGDILLWLHPGTRTADRTVRNFALTGQGFAPRESYPATGYDPRQRPFYQAALDGPPGGTWMPAYPWIIHAPGNNRPASEALWGFSYVKALRDSTGRPVAVLDTDLDMPALNSFMADLGREYQASLRVIELGAQPRLIAAPGAGREPLPLPPELAALATPSADAFTGRIALDGERQWVAAHRLELPGGVSWLVVASRAAPFIEAPLRRQLFQVLGMGLAIAIGLALVSTRVASRFGRPLAALKQRVASIEHHLPDLPTASTASASDGFRETQLLGEALDRMAEAIRQHTLARELQVASLALKGALFDLTSAAILSLDDQRRIVEWNASAQRLFGQNRDRVLGQPAGDVIRAADGPADWDAILDRTSEAITLRLRGAHGPFDAERRLVAFTQEGRNIHTLILSDVSERQDIERRLRQERDYADAVLNSLPGVFYQCDERPRLVRWNSNFEKITGYTPEELAGADPLMFFTDEDKPLIASRIGELFRKGESSAAEADYLLKDGRCIPYLFTAVRFEYDGKQGFVGVGTDITERKQAQDQLRTFNAELEKHVADRTAELRAINQELDAFCHSVAHDLRAPLRGIAGYASLLAQEHAGRLEGEGRDFLARVQAAAKRMGELIDDLLMLSRISRADMQRGPVDLSAIAREVLAGLRQAEPQRQVEATIEDGLHTQGDARLLRIVLENLLGNAWKFTSKTPRARIAFTRVTGGEPGQPPAFAVSDNGAGFDMRHAGKLFGTFQRLHAGTDFPGTGVGLATVHRIITRHGGQIRARAEPGKGATFEFLV